MTITSDEFFGKDLKVYDTKMTETEKLKAQIQELQEKLQKLEEIEKQPRMNLQQEGEYAVVSYHDKVYYRLEGEDTFSWYIKKNRDDNHHVYYLSPNLVMVEDAETERLLEGLYYNHIQVKKEKEQRTKTPVEECYKDWWGQYPELETDSQYDDTRWQGFQAGYEFAYAISTAKEVMEKVQEEQEDTVWKTVALRFGRKLPVILPYSYDELSPDAWFRWVVFTYDNYMKQRDKESGYTPKAQERGERVHKEVEELITKIHDGYEVVEYQPTPQTPEQVNTFAPKELEELVRESVKWCEENPDKDPLDWLKPQTPEETAQSLKEAFVKAQQTENWKETQKLIDEEDNDKNFKNSLDLIKEWGEEHKPKTLYQICMEWWDEVFVNQMVSDACIDVLVSRIDTEFLPPSHDTNGYEWEKCLKMMREKLR